MKKETKDTIVAVGSTLVTVCASTVLGWGACYGTAAVMNLVVKDGFPKVAGKIINNTLVIGGIGIAWASMDPIYAGIRGKLEDVMDIFPTDPEIKEANNG